MRVFISLIAPAAFAGAFFSVYAPAASAEYPEVDDKGIYSVVLENDLFSSTDRHYTNGIRFAWLSPESHIPKWADWMTALLPHTENSPKRMQVALGQSMYTPQDISLRTPIRDDRPYGGWLYGSLGVVADSGRTLDNLMLSVGVVGPASQADNSQKFIHRLIGSPHPFGWRNQLKNEPGVQLTYERKWRALYEFSPFGAGVDATPHVGFNLGNVFTDASVGATFRLGYDLPADYGPPRIRPSLPGSDFFIPTRTLGGYLFAGVEGRAVGRNIFLDGNTFTDSLHVEREPLVGSLQAGAALTWANTRLSYTHVFMTREFKGQGSTDQFGAVSLSLRF